MTRKNRRAIKRRLNKPGEIHCATRGQYLDHLSYAQELRRLEIPVRATLVIGFGPHAGATVTEAELPRLTFITHALGNQ